MLSYVCAPVGDFYLVKEKKKNHAWLIGFISNFQEPEKESSLSVSRKKMNKTGLGTYGDG